MKSMMNAYGILVFSNGFFSIKEIKIDSKYSHDSIILYLEVILRAVFK